MTPQFAPPDRLRRARVCVVAPTPGEAWRGWCQTVFSAGTGMIVVPGSPGVGPWLAVARTVAGRRLVAVAEPAPVGTLADVVHLGEPAHAAAWPGRLWGCTVTSVADAVAARAAGCAYLVVAVAPPGLLEAVRAATAGPLFAACRTGVEVGDVIARGAERLWLEAPAASDIRQWSNWLRGAGRAARPERRD